MPVASPAPPHPDRSTSSSSFAAEEAISELRAMWPELDQWRQRVIPHGQEGTQ